MGELDDGFHVEDDGLGIPDLKRKIVKGRRNRIVVSGQRGRPIAREIGRQEIRGRASLAVDENEPRGYHRHQQAPIGLDSRRREMKI